MPGVRRRLANLSILAFLAVQVALPMRILARENWWPSGRGGHEFSWAMYARPFEYAQRYTILAPGRAPETLDPRDYLPLPQQFSVILNERRIARFNRWLCARLRAQGRLPPGARLSAHVELRPTHGPPIVLSRGRDDACAGGPS